VSGASPFESAWVTPATSARNPPLRYTLYLVAPDTAVQDKLTAAEDATAAVSVGVEEGGVQEIPSADMASRNPYPVSALPAFEKLKWPPPRLAERFPNALARA